MSEKKEISTVEPKELKDSNKVIVEVDRSPEVESINKQLQEREAQLKKLQEDFATTSKQLEDYMTEEKDKDSKYNELETEFNTARDQLKEIAHTEFLKVKEEKLTVLRNAKVPDERIKEFDEKIKEPADLDQVDWMLATLADSFVKAEEARRKDADDAAAKALVDDAAAKELADEGKELEAQIKEDEITMPTNTPNNPPKHGVVTTPPVPVKSKWEYASARDAVTDLYRKIAAEGPDAPEAKKLVDGLWDKFATTLKKNQSLGFSISQCPVCGAGILEDENCPFCDFDPRMFKARGGELWVTR